jgi:transitional endoplasmic reticulum ATPase
MPGWRLREFHPDDLDGILRLWEQTHRDGSEPVYALSEVLASCQKDYAVVALRGEEVVGACVGRAAHEQGWIVFCATKEAKPELAEQYGIVPPRAVVLFGPPGTGKTTFAKAIASRLEWSFVEVFPSRLAADPLGLAGALRATFEKVAELEHAVVFIDEVEEIAARRGGEPPSTMQGVTNELLKLIPAFREQPDRLLVVATNFIRALDPAFLRHGRFDYVIPIGLPDAAARRAIWARYVPAAVRDQVDLDQVVAQSDGFSPADVEYAARSASQHALEASLEGSGREGPVTEDYLLAVAGTRATVSAEVAAEFEEDIVTLARL